MKKSFRRALAMLLASLMLVSALPVYAAGEEAPAQDDPWMDYAQEHLGNTLPFMREEELSFLEPGCQVYLGKRLSAYNSELDELPYAMYPVFADGQMVAIASVSEDENGELSFQAGPQFAEQLNEFIADNPNVALVMNEDSIQFINDEGETETLAFFEDSAVPLSLASDVECSQAVPVTAIQEVPRTRAYGEDSGTVPIKYVPQGKYAICWAACMASVVNYFNGTNHSAVWMADYLGKDYDDKETSGAIPSECNYWYAHTFNLSPVLSSNNLSYDLVYNNAYAKKPIHAHVEGWDKKGDRHGHVVVIRGCYMSNSVVYYRIMDPNYGFSSVKMNSDGSFDVAYVDYTMKPYAYIRFN